MEPMNDQFPVLKGDRRRLIDAQKMDEARRSCGVPSSMVPSARTSLLAPWTGSSSPPRCWTRTGFAFAG